MGELVKVAPISVEFSAILLVKKSVVAPFPYQTSLRQGVGSEELNVFQETPGPIAHSVRKFTQQETLVGIVSHMLDHSLRRGIHLAVEVGTGGVPVLLIMDYPGGVSFLNPIIHGCLIPSVEALVAQGPDNDRSVVLESCH